MRKAQLSLMIIIGLVLVALVGLGYYVMNSSAEKREAGTVQGVQLNREMVEPIKRFEQSCFTNAITQAMLDIGAQGGVLYTSQGGLQDDGWQQDGETVLVIDRTPVAYGILAPQEPASPYSLDYGQGTYPWKTFPFVGPCVAGSPCNKQYTGYFGVVSLPELNSTADATFEKQLSASITARLDGNTRVKPCLEWSQFSQLPITITAQPAHVRVMMNDNDVTFVLNKTVTLAAKDRSGKTDLPAVTYTVPVHLKRLYNLTRRVLAADVSDITFNPTDVSEDGFNVVKRLDVSTNHPGDDLLVFIDEKGFLEGKPYRLQVMRKNRVPALEKPLPLPLVQLCLGAIISRHGNNLDYACAGDSASIFAPDSVARDPDEDNVSIDFLPTINLKLDDTNSFQVQRGLVAGHGITVEVRATEQDDITHTDFEHVFLPVQDRVAVSVPAAGSVDTGVDTSDDTSGDEEI